MKNHQLFASLLAIVSLLGFQHVSFSQNGIKRDGHKVDMLKDTTYQKCYLDSALFYLKKANAGKKIDSLVFVNGVKMLERIPSDANLIQQLENEIANFKTPEKADYYAILQIALFYRFVNNQERYKAIDFGQKIISRVDAEQSPAYRNLGLLALSELRIPYRTSDKLNEGFDFYASKLRQYLEENDSDKISICYYVLGGFYYTRGLNELAIYNYKKSIGFLNANQLSTPVIFGLLLFTGHMAWINHTSVVGQRYISVGNYHESLRYSRAAHKTILADIGQMKDSSNLAYTAYNIAYAKLLLDETDSVGQYLDFSLQIANLQNIHTFQAVANMIKGFYYLKIDKLDSAEVCLNECSKLVAKYNLPANSTGGAIIPGYYMALVRIEQKRFKEAELLLKEEIERLGNMRAYLLNEYKLLADVYTLWGDDKLANATLKKYISLQEQLTADEKENRSLSFEIEKKIGDAESMIADLRIEKKVATLSRNYLVGIAVLLLCIAIVLYNRYRLKQKSNARLAKTLQELKDTQEQLLKSEKLAAFGAVASRMAHEIQNPLNFVNNFSQISEGMLKEILAISDEEERNEVMASLAENLQKINHHGKRADGIVKELQERVRAGTTHEFFEGDEKR